ncbi:NAD(P)H nitroreductase [Alteromonas sp. a30]|uniref:NAD(P)H nitroreductase n=1 Tax=Alteromonas sp. a30 TaxID=2730917 RepID=UPI00227F0EE2|nr:NAD(P)H nitroreductase [Alteromonas sp. a30]MCY7294011.1 NAD(P)H nitroreductase [Alteromonas sp. a30]
MKALDLLLERSSSPRLQEPAPDAEALKNILKAGIRVPDHGGLTPFRFIVCTGEGLKKLGNIFEDVAKRSHLSEADILRAPELPLRAPMVIIAVTDYKSHPKISKVEQICTTACSVHSMQMAALAQSYSGIWRTGYYATSTLMKEALFLKEEDEIVGFLYLGTPVEGNVAKPEKDYDTYVDFWS